MDKEKFLKNAASEFKEASDKFKEYVDSFNAAFANKKFSYDEVVWDGEVTKFVDLNSKIVDFFQHMKDKFGNDVGGIETVKEFQTKVVDAAKKLKEILDDKKSENSEDAMKKANEYLDIIWNKLSSAINKTSLEIISLKNQDIIKRRQERIASGFKEVSDDFKKQVDEFNKAFKGKEFKYDEVVWDRKATKFVDLNSKIVDFFQHMKDKFGNDVGGIETVKEFQTKVVDAAKKLESTVWDKSKLPKDATKQADEYLSIILGNFRSEIDAVVLQVDSLKRQGIRRNNKEKAKKLQTPKENVGKFASKDDAEKKAEPTPQAGTDKPAPPNHAPKKRPVPPTNKPKKRPAPPTERPKKRPAPPTSKPKKRSAPPKNGPYVSVFKSSFKQIDLSNIKNADEFQKLYTKFNGLKRLCPKWYEFIEDTFNDNKVKKALNENTVVGIFLASCSAADNPGVSKAACDAMKCVIDKTKNSKAKAVWGDINKDINEPAKMKTSVQNGLKNDLNIAQDVVTAIIGYIK